MKIKELLHRLWNCEYSLKKAFWVFGVGGYLTCVLFSAIFYSAISVFLNLGRADSLFLYGGLTLLFSIYIVFFSLCLYRTARYSDSKELYCLLAYIAATIFLILGIRGLYNSFISILGSFAISSRYYTTHGNLSNKILSWILLLGIGYGINLIYSFIVSHFNTSRQHKINTIETSEQNVNIKTDPDTNKHSDLSTDRLILQHRTNFANNDKQLLMTANQLILQCHTEVHKIKTDFASRAKYSNLDWFFDSLDKRIEQHKEQIIENFKTEKGLTVDNYILYQIVETSFNIIMSGSYCSYRGHLNMEGQDLKLLHTYANREMCHRGYMDSEISQDNINYLDEEIKKLG